MFWMYWDHRAALQHVALVTGLKHYLGPFEAYAQGNVPVTPFREAQGRQPVDNFYYEQEDRVLEAAHRYGFGWSVHRSHTIIGFAPGNAMNMGTTLAAYASVCKTTGQPFLFPGSRNSMERSDGHDRCTTARASSRMGEYLAERQQRILQRREWRRIPVEVDVVTDHAIFRH